MTVIEKAAWSASRLKTFAQCQKKAWHDAYAPAKSPERAPYEETPATKRGNAVHRAMELRVINGRPLPPEFAAFERPYVERALALKSQAQIYSAEQSWSFSRSLDEVDWFDKAAWVRAKLDFVAIVGTRGYTLDWKTGKVNIDETQLEVYALLLFLKYPQLEYVEASYEWLDADDRTVRVYQVGSAEQLLDRVLAKTSQIDACVASGVWRPSPSDFNCGYCSANKHKLCADAIRGYKGS